MLSYCISNLAYTRNSEKFLILGFFVYVQYSRPNQWVSELRVNGIRHPIRSRFSHEKIKSWNSLKLLTIQLLYSPNSGFGQHYVNLR